MCHLRQGHGKICVIYDGLRKVYSLKIKLLMPSQTRAVCLLVSPAGFDRAYKTCRGRSASTWSVHEGVKTYLFYGFHMGTNNLFGQPARLKIIRSLKIKRELGRVNNHCLCFWMKSWSKKMLYGHLSSALACKISSFARCPRLIKIGILFKCSTTPEKVETFYCHDKIFAVANWMLCGIDLILSAGDLGFLSWFGNWIWTI